MRKLLLKQKPRKTRKKQLLRKTRKRSNLGIGFIGGLWPSDNPKKAGVSLPFL
jgi:hypothetical protein